LIIIVNWSGLFLIKRGQSVVSMCILKFAYFIWLLF
jgi:hypothetical protein